MWRVFKLFPCLLAVVILVGAHSAFADYGQGGSAPLKVLGDHLLVPFTYKTEGFEKQSYFIVDLGSNDYVAIHEAIYDSIDPVLQPGEKVRLFNGGLELSVELKECRRVARGSTVLDSLSSRYDIELNNVDITAIVGFEFLKRFAINFNIEDKTFSLTPSSPSHTAQVRQQSQAFISGLTVSGHNLYVPVSAKGEQVGTMELQTAGYHTTIAPKLAGELNKSSDITFGNPGVDQQLSGMVALRTQKLPKPIDTTPANRVMRSGIGLWAPFDVTIDPQGGYLALASTKNSNFHDGDAAFYKASAARNWDQLYDYLQAFPKGRNVEEAVDEMFSIGLKSKAPADKQLVALQVALDQMRPRRKFTYVFDYCQKAHDAMPSSAYMEMTIGVCEKGLEYVSYSQTPGTRQDYQLILGERYLDKGDVRQSWKYYLSASFNGDPKKDDVTRMGLGRAYEAMKRYRRAYATYARLAADLPEEKVAEIGLDFAIERVAKQLDPNDPLLTGKK